MNYSELIESIDDCSGVSGKVFDEYKWARTYWKETDESTDIIKHIIDIALSDPKAWYVLGKNGEKIHFGDKVKRNDGVYVGAVQGLDMTYGEPFLWVSDSEFNVCAKTCTKINKDTRKTIINEMMEDFDITKECADAWIERIKAVKE